MAMQAAQANPIPITMFQDIWIMRVAAIHTYSPVDGVLDEHLKPANLHILYYQMHYKISGITL